MKLELEMEWDGVTERRCGKDRRDKETWRLNIFSTRQKRRTHLRRAEDRQRVVLLDQYSGSIVVVFILVLLLSIADAVLTLFLIEHGAIEANPVMNFYLAKGVPTFVIVKYLLTATSAMIIVMSHYVKMPFTNMINTSLLKLFAAGFASVISWELYLTFRYVL